VIRWLETGCGEKSGKLAFLAVLLIVDEGIYGCGLPIDDVNQAANCFGLLFSYLSLSLGGCLKICHTCFNLTEANGDHLGKSPNLVNQNINLLWLVAIALGQTVNRKRLLRLIRIL
jgi:hypothetical protein